MCSSDLDLLTAAGDPVRTAAPLRLNSWIRDGSDTTSTVQLSLRASAGALRVTLNRDALRADSITAPAGVADSGTGPVTDVFVDAELWLRARNAGGSITFAPSP